MTNANEDLFKDMEEVESGVLKFGKVGDYFKGTLVSIAKESVNRISEKGEMQRVFEFKAIVGSFHNIVKKKVNDKPTVIAPGESYIYFSKGMTKKMLEKAKVGQEVGIQFVEEKEARQPGYSDTKIIRVLLGKMNEEWLKENPELPTA